MSHFQLSFVRSLFIDLEKQAQTDCKFIFEGKRSLAAHKLILGHASPVFNAMFYGGLKEQGDVIIEDIEYEIFCKLIW